MKVDGLSLSSFIVLICLFIVKFEVNIVKYEIEFYEMLAYNCSCYYSHCKMFFFPLRNADSKDKMTGFASQLHLLVNALNVSFEAQFMEDFISGLK